MKKLLTLFFIASLFTLVVSVLVPKNIASQREVDFLVTKGEGTRDIALNLEKQKLIYWSPLFRFFVLTVGISNNLQAGTYELSPSMSSLEIALKMSSGDVKETTITIVEGWNLQDIGLYLEEKGIVQAEELWETTGVPGVDYRGAAGLPYPADLSQNFPFLAEKPAFVGLEGYLFPDTYKVRPGESAKTVVSLMLLNFQKKIEALKEDIVQEEKSVFEIVTVASLLEKEVQTKEDKQLVAGVIQNRLDIGMGLQIDATVSYLTGRKDTAVTKEETRIDSRYNTYAYPGLPLGPIANPGLESIEAALNPTENPYFYYLSTLEGETIFSRTLEEHNKAKAEHIR